MSKYPDDLKYTKEHEWIKIDDNVGVIGITDYAVEQLGDIVHIELPESGAELEQGTSCGVVESVKSVSDLYIPVGAKVIDVNSALESNLGLIAEDPYGEGWIAKIEIQNPAEVDSLMSADGYESFLSEEA